MASRTAFPGTATDSTIHTAADDNKLPGGWIGYAEVTAGQTGIGGTDTDLTGLSVAVTVNTSRRIKVSCQATTVADSGTPNIRLKIKEGATQLTQLVREQTATGGGTSGQTITGSWIGTPSAGSHTYKLALQTTSATGGIFASSTEPAWLLVEDLGPAS